MTVYLRDNMVVDGDDLTEPIHVVVAGEGVVIRNCFIEDRDGKCWLSGGSRGAA